MQSVDPTRFRVDAHALVHTHDADSFQDLMADQIRHAPWVMLSILLHGMVVLLVLLLPSSAPIEIEERVIQMTQPETPEELVDPTPPPEEPPTPEEPTDEPELQDPFLTEIDDVSDNTLDDLIAEPTTESTFTNDSWNQSIGLLGGAGGPNGLRGDGRAGLGKRGKRGVAERIRSALEWLKNHQDEDGSWDADEFMKHDVQGEPCSGAGNPVHDVGLTGLALLAFLGDGSTLRSGDYRQVVKKAVSWLREQQDPDTGLFGTNSSNEFVYNHAIATLAMVEAYGLSDYKLLRPNAQRAIDYLEWHRNPYSVWRYQPRDGDNDTSVTGWCVMALKSAKDFGLTVNDSAMKLSEAWFDQMTDPVTARCGYTDRGGLSSRLAGEHAGAFPREKGECMTAVSLLCRIFLGHQPTDDPLMDRQADLILGKPPVWNAADGSIDHYYWYYGTYALYQMGGRRWKTWSERLTPAVVETQRRDGNYHGSWDPAGAWGEHGGRVYSTAILCLTLEAYYRYTRLVR